MDELKLLEKLIVLEEELERKKIQYSVYTPTDELKREIENTSNQIAEIEKSLEDIEDKTNSTKAREHIYEQLLRYVEKIEAIDPYLKLSRSQRMYKNYLFSRIVIDISYFVEKRIYGIYIPILYCASDVKDQVENTELIEFLKQEMQVILGIKHVNYPVLRKYFKEFRERMFTKFVYDNK